jgi:hypothetical protein
MSEIKPSNVDVVMGGQNHPPVGAAVLGGGAVANRRQLAQQWNLSPEVGERFSLYNDLICIKLT